MRMTELTVPPKQLLTAPWYKAAENTKKEPPLYIPPPLEAAISLLRL